MVGIAPYKLSRFKLVAPKDTIELQYNVFGAVKVDRGIFYAQEEKKTGEYQFTVAL
jgi:hypothetical protein